jgi:rSAM/selenodomain-associated transferase 2
VPVLNEAELIGGFLLQLRANAPDAEIILVDGSSEDRTIAESAGLADQVLIAPRGRARQMNAGAAVARGEVFWFLHADLLIPQNALDEIAKTLGESAAVGGCFRVRFPRPEWVYRLGDSLGNAGVEIFRFALGDHGIFCRRVAFCAVGGFPDVPLMEDAEIYRALRRVGRMHQLRKAIVASPRRFEQHGPWRTTAYYAAILALYVAGVRIDVLTAIYRRLTRDAGRRALLRTHSARRARSESMGTFSRSTRAPSGPRQ